MSWYKTGTLTLVNGSTTVVGVGTDFISGANVGEAMYINDELYEIGAIVSATQLTLVTPWLGATDTGVAYQIIPTQSLVADLAAGVSDLITDYSVVKDTAGAGKFDDGTVTAPGITFEADQNTGMYKINNDNFGLTAGGIKQVDISSTDVELNYGGNKKLATTSTGVDVTGTVTADGLTVDGVNLSTATHALEISRRTDTSNTDILIKDLDGSVIVGQNHHQTEYYSTDGAQVSAKVRTTYSDVSGGMDYTISTSGAGVAVRDRLKINSGGDVHLFDDTGTTAKFVWDSSAESLSINSGAAFPLSLDSSHGETILKLDNSSTNGRRYWLISGGSSGSFAGGKFGVYDADSLSVPFLIDSSGNVGIGTISPQDRLHVAGNIRIDNAGYYVSETSTGGAVRMLGINSGDVAYVGGIDSGIASTIFNASSTSNTASFYTAGSERARIDSSGNLLVGKTSTAGTKGVIAYNTGALEAIRDGAGALFVNRLNSDGTLAEFRKDGSTVGAIGSRVGQVSYLVLDPRSAFGGAGLGTTSQAIVPCDHNGDNTDGVNDFGDSNSRWRNLYLSGGVYLGGTGSANKLDDYETGTWTPAVGVNNFSSSPTTLTGNYTKIGRIVTARLTLSFSSSITMSSYSTITGLPFSTVGQAGAIAATNTVGSHARVAASGTQLFFTYLEGSPNTIELVITYQTS